MGVNVDGGGRMGLGIRRMPIVNSIFMSDILNNLCDLIFGARL